MKGKVTTTTTATAKQHISNNARLVNLDTRGAGVWVRINNDGFQTGERHAKLGSQNSFTAVHKFAGTVTVITTGTHKGLWQFVSAH